MFDGTSPEIAQLAELDDAALVEAATSWARAENAACARKLAVMAELFARRTGLPADEREDWFVDPTAAVGAELAAAQGITKGLALAQARRGVALRDRLPAVGALFAEGTISDLLVRTIVDRTALVVDPNARTAIDEELAAHAATFGKLSVKKLEVRIDSAVEHHDPGAVRRCRSAGRSRGVSFGSPTDEPGVTSLWARMFAPDAAALEKRLDAMARSVCTEDPRTLDERRADALGAIGDDHELRCECGQPDCAARDRDTAADKSAVVYVIADDTTVADCQQPPPAETAAPDPVAPTFVLGGGVLPASLLGPMLARAHVRRVCHPGNAPAEPRYRPSAALAAFVRCRDLTCRWPGCDVPADRCDIDHTVPYPDGPTHASNLACLCRFHHLLKTFWTGDRGWHSWQSPDGTVTWTAPTGHVYTTEPGSKLLFPRLCKPTAALGLVTVTEPVTGERGVMMPKRRRTRADDEAYRTEAERRLNDELVEEHNRPPPF